MHKIVDFWKKYTAKEKIALYIISILSSFMMQLIWNEVDYQGYIEKYGTVNPLTPVVHYSPLEDGGYFLGVGSMCLLDVSDVTARGVMLEFLEPTDFIYGIDILYEYQAEDGQVKKGIISEYFHQCENYLYYPLPSFEINELEINIYIPEEMLTKLNVTASEHTDLPQLPTRVPDKDLYLKNIYSFSEEWTQASKQLTKIHAVDTLLFALLSMALIHSYIYWMDKKQLQLQLFLPFIVLFVLLQVIFMGKHIQGDDYWLFLELKEQYNLWEYSVMRYQIWNSRFFVELFPYLLNDQWALWSVLTGLMAVLLCYCFAQICKPLSFVKNLIIATLFLSYPLNDFLEVGWIATSCNYLWVVALLVYCFYVVYRMGSGEKLRKGEYIISYIACLYATNQEQGAALAVGFYTVFSMYFLWKKIALKPLFPYYMITILNFVNHLVCPANAVRYDKNIPLFFPNFEEVSLLTKLEMGYSSSLTHIFSYNTLLVECCLYLIILVAIKRAATIGKNGIAINEDAKVQVQKSIHPLLYIIFPLMVIHSFNILRGNAVVGLEPVRYFEEMMTQTGTNPNLFQLETCYPIFVLTFAFVGVLLAVYLSIEDKMIGLFADVVLCAGLCSRIILAFSPLVWIMDLRTYLFFYFAFAFVALLLFGELEKLCNNQEKKIISVTCVCLCAFQVVSFL